MSLDDYYNSHRARLDTLIGENVEFYASLKRAKDLWNVDNANQPTENFLTYLEDMYGIRMSASQKMSGVDTGYQIADEKKYMMFLLKYLNNAQV
jgi:hypothetical protein